MFKRLSIFLYGVVSYAVFFGTFFTPWDSSATSVYRKPSTVAASGTWRSALLVDLGLLGLFALQHSVMARPAFKRWWTRIVPGARRAQHVCARVQPRAPCCFWMAAARRRRLEGRVHGARPRSTGCFAFGWLTGAGHHVPHQPLRPVRAAPGLAPPRGGPTGQLAFVTPGPYRLVRHPALRRLAVRLLGDADDDGVAPPLRGHDHGLHPDRDPARGARSRRVPRRGVPGYRQRVPMLIPFARKRNLDDPFLRRQRWLGIGSPRKKAALLLKEGAAFFLFLCHHHIGEFEIAGRTAELECFRLEVAELGCCVGPCHRHFQQPACISVAR